jgi:drug/metabolite transporter (DMT)-like permease
MYYVYAISCVFWGLFIVNLVFSYQSKHIDSAILPTFKFHVLALPIFLMANMLIGYGIKIGFKVVGNLSYVLATSKGLEIIISLIMGYLFLKEIPTWKTLVGFVIVIIGFIVAKLK